MTLNRRRLIQDGRQIGIALDQLANRSLAQADITGVQALTLLYILQNSREGVSVTSLHLASGHSKATVSRLVKRLWEKGYVSLEPSRKDGRQRLLYGTQEGRRLQGFLEPDYEPMCPIEIQVNGERAYYIYLEYVWEPEDSYDSRLPIVSSPQEEDMAFYVESGSSAELYVPIGVYRAYYASGYSWQGPEELFGEDTEYNRDIYLLDFYTDEESAYGYTLELWDDTENNPDMEPIAPEDFPS